MMIYSLRLRAIHTLYIPLIPCIRLKVLPLQLAAIEAVHYPEGSGVFPFVGRDNESLRPSDDFEDLDLSKVRLNNSLNVA